MTKAFALALFLFGCASPKPVVPPAPPPPPANFQVVVSETVERPEDEGTAYAKVFIDGTLAGQTDTGPRSLEKSFAARVPAGNRLIKIEYWTLPGLGPWEKLPDDEQPRERFYRVADNTKTKIAVRFSELGRRNSVQVTREPLP